MSQLQAMHPLVLFGILAAVPTLAGIHLNWCFLPSLSTPHHCHHLEACVRLTFTYIIEGSSNDSSFPQGWIDNFNGTSGIFIAVRLVTVQAPL